MRIELLGVVAATTLVLGCHAEDPSGPGPGDPVPHDPVPHVTGEFVGRYLVPVTDAALEVAAIFPVDHVDWTVAAGVATLHYELPLGLVGGEVDVTLTGPIEPGQTTVYLSGAVGTGVCTARGRIVTCREEFVNLGVLPIDTTVIEQRAGVEYAGPVSDRLQVANLFGSDPIGIVDFDLDLPFVEPDDD